MRQTLADEDLIREGLDGVPDLRVAEEVELVEVVVQLVQLLSPLEPFLLRYLFDKKASKQSRLAFCFDKKTNVSFGSCNCQYAVPFRRV